MGDSRCEDCGFVRQSVPGFYGCLCMGFGDNDQGAMNSAVAEARAWKAGAEEAEREQNEYRQRVWEEEDA